MYSAIDKFLLLKIACRNSRVASQCGKMASSGDALSFKNSCDEFEPSKVDKAFELDVDGTNIKNMIKPYACGLISYQKLFTIDTFFSV